MIKIIVAPKLDFRSLCMADDVNLVWVSPIHTFNGLMVGSFTLGPHKYIKYMHICKIQNEKPVNAVIVTTAFGNFVGHSSVH